MELLTSLDLCSTELDAALQPYFIESAPQMPAHLTVLWPWVRKPTATDYATVGAIAGRTGRLEVECTSTAVFDQALVLLCRAGPEFAEFCAEIYRAFPQCPPYRGKHADLLPHITVVVGDKRRRAEAETAVMRSALLPFRVEFSEISVYRGSDEVPWRALRSHAFGAEPPR